MNQILEKTTAKMRDGSSGPELKHFYINNAHVETKIKSTISVTIDPKQ